jgi:predicted SprT family Zn-dependent metalloprotease
MSTTTDTSMMQFTQAPLTQYMLYVDRSKTAFLCECGCNVFHRVTDNKRPDELTYECNACREWYAAERDE